ncbi:MAG TPA: PIG-L family deacetylase [Polyangiaceae bacterium]|jgi:LmbE family N-acetylglucosaminyl deacetylase|nr:PIG-L family deacetylase [Polyangiaceae bacterium]
MAVTALVEPRRTAEREWAACRRPATLPEMTWPAGRIVVVAPHPDDETLALGGTLNRFAREGRDVTVVGVTDGEASHPRSPTTTRSALGERRSRERLAALERLGLSRAEVVRFGEPDGGVQAPALVSRLAEILRGAALCLAPWRHDGHPDHDAAGEAVAEAALRTGVPFAEYLVWTWHWARPHSDDVPWERARRSSFDDESGRAKAHAVSAYVSQIAPLSDRAGDEAILDEEMLAHFRRSFEIVLV